MTNAARIAGPLMALMLGSSAWGQAPGFAAKPAAERAGDGARIRFAVAGPTDVTVAVLDAGGRVVRHLAAGALGGQNPPPGPLRAGLAQELVWDGRDDAGRPAAGPDRSGLRVRVGLGLRAEFERIIGWNGQNIDFPRALAVGPDGTLYLLHGKGLSGHRQTALIAAYDRDGRYLRQVFPGPGGLGPAARRGWPHVALPDGEEAPVVQHLLTRSVYPAAYFGDAEVSNLAVAGDGRLLAVSGSYDFGKALIKNADVRGGRRLLAWHADGTAPAETVGPVIVGENVGGRPRLAAWRRESVSSSYSVTLTASTPRAAAVSSQTARSAAPRSSWALSRAAVRASDWARAALWRSRQAIWCLYSAISTPARSSLSSKGFKM